MPDPGNGAPPARGIAIAIAPALAMPMAFPADAVPSTRAVAGGASICPWAHEGWDNGPMTTPDNDSRRQAWSSYWAQGALHSCIGSFDANYSGAIGAFWDALVAGIAPGARVLDLATGNGALPLRLWQRLGRAAQLRIDAVDLAALAPPWYRPETHPGIAFHSGVAMEALPFADGTFDRVVSQFGLEYGRRPEALHECLRVARADARLAFVLHHAGSVLVTVGHAELANQELLMAPDGLIAAARRVLPWIARARSGAGIPAADPRAAQDRNLYNAAVGRLGQAIADSAVPDALVEGRDWIHQLLSGVTGADVQARIDALDAYRQGMQSAALRTQEMLEHALDAAQAEAMARVFTAARPGCEVRCEPLFQREGVLAWGMVVSPRPD
jgi:hypothetical protein